MLELQVSDSTNLALYRRVARSICDALRAGRLQPGDALPPRHVLGSQLGVSTTSINDACQWLESRGILAGRRGRGTCVQAEALRHLNDGARRFDSLIVVAGVSRLADCDREHGYLYNQIITGVGDVLGADSPRFTFASALDRGCMDNMSANSAVLLDNAMQRRADPAVVDELVRRRVPVVSIWTSPCRFDIPHVWHDPRQAVDVGIRYLIACGYRRIGFIGNKGVGGDVWLGVKFMQFTNTLQEAGLDFRARDVRNVGGVSEGLGRAYQAAKEIIASGDPPEALFADTDFKAIEVLHAIRDASLRVPDDIAVIGCDGLPEAEHVDPPLTTVSEPRRAIGRRTAQILLDWQENGEPPAQCSGTQNLLPPELIIRNTTPAVDRLTPVQQINPIVATSP